MNGREILELLNQDYCGLDSVRYVKRYHNGDNKLKCIHWLMRNFDCSYGVARRLVEKVNR